MDIRIYQREREKKKVSTIWWWLLFCGFFSVCVCVNKKNHLYIPRFFCFFSTIYSFFCLVSMCKIKKKELSVNFLLIHSLKKTQWTTTTKKISNHRQTQKQYNRNNKAIKKPGKHNTTQHKQTNIDHRPAKQKKKKFLIFCHKSTSFNGLYLLLLLLLADDCINHKKAAIYRKENFFFVGKPGFFLKWLFITKHLWKL